MDKILVVGGAGFIGSHLCKKLLETAKVYCLDNFSTGHLENIFDLTEDKNFELIEGEAEDFESRINFDYIYHLGSPASPKAYQELSLKTFSSNVLGSLNLLKLAQKTGARILLASTSEVYGNPLEHPQSETYWGNVNPIGIRSCYDESKRAAETLFFEYHILKVNACIVRIFNTYGENMDRYDGRVVSNFINQALNDQNITVYGNGMQTRSLCYVSDTVKGIIAMAKSELFGPINIGNPFEITIKELAEIIKKLTNSKSEIVYEFLPEDDPLRRNPDITKAKNCLKWKPEISLDEGLRKTITYYKER